MKKRSTNREAQRRKLVLQGETIVLLRPAELGEVQGGEGGLSDATKGSGTRVTKPDEDE